MSESRALRAEPLAALVSAIWLGNNPESADANCDVGRCSVVGAVVRWCVGASVGWCVGGLVLWRVGGGVAQRARALPPRSTVGDPSGPSSRLWRRGVEESRRRRGRVRGRVRGRGSKAKIENEFCGGGLRWGWMLGSRVGFEVGMDSGDRDGDAVAEWDHAIVTSPPVTGHQRVQWYMYAPYSGRSVSAGSVRA